jgi:hypothetical protein
MMMVWTDAAEAGILERIEPAIADTSKELGAYIKLHAEFIEIGNRTVFSIGVHPRSLVHPLDSPWKDYEMRKGSTRKPQAD